MRFFMVHNRASPSSDRTKAVLTLRTPRLSGFITTVIGKHLSCNGIATSHEVDNSRMKRDPDFHVRIEVALCSRARGKEDF
jgi:hypothetical protein